MATMATTTVPDPYWTLTWSRTNKNPLTTHMMMIKEKANVSLNWDKTIEPNSKKI
jgi:hypothetical protein